MERTERDIRREEMSGLRERSRRDLRQKEGSRSALVEVTGESIRDRFQSRESEFSGSRSFRYFIIDDINKSIENVRQKLLTHESDLQVQRSHMDLSAGKRVLPSNESHISFPVDLHDFSTPEPSQTAFNLSFSAKYNGHSAGVSALLVTSNTIWSGSSDKTIKVWRNSVQSPYSSFGKRRLEEAATLRRHYAQINALATYPREVVLSASHDKSIGVWDSERFEFRRFLKGHAAYVGSLSVHAEDIVSSGGDSILVWDLGIGQMKIRIQPKDYSFCTLAPASQLYPKMLATGDLDGRLTVYDLRSDRIMMTAKPHRKKIIAVRNVENLLITCSTDQFLRMTDIRTGRLLAELELNSQINCIDVATIRQPTFFLGCDDGFHLATMSKSDGSLQEMPLTVRGENNMESIRSILYDEPNRRLLVGCQSPILKVWDIEQSSSFNSRIFTTNL
eukprot:TRINITY_DN6838_c0_g1_i3.p1 TRINITY_DN6838_c0_g1~~TRINITY_DN6838_c0_g1_i3.p1  ORF type:complete len:447 (-),score=42.50 TRINITY_DN6838_c0_g1_i3:83-1423(-)